MGGDCSESCFTISLIVRDKVTRQCPQTTTFEERERERERERAEAESKRGPSAYHSDALSPGQTCSPAPKSTMGTFTVLCFP